MSQTSASQDAQSETLETIRRDMAMVKDTLRLIAGQLFPEPPQFWTSSLTIGGDDDYEIERVECPR